MLSATITWTTAAWVYVVHDGDEPLERGVVRGAGWEDEAAVVALQLRVRWPALEPGSCVVLHGPQGPAIPARGGHAGARPARRARGRTQRASPAAVRGAR